MSELATQILRVLHENYLVNETLTESSIMSLLGGYVGTLNDFDAAMKELASMGYVRYLVEDVYQILAFDRSMSCAVCGTYALKHCPGCKALLCDEHYTAHLADNAEYLKGLKL